MEALRQDAEAAPYHSDNQTPSPLVRSPDRATVFTARLVAGTTDLQFETKRYRTNLLVRELCTEDKDTVERHAVRHDEHDAHFEMVTIVSNDGEEPAVGFDQDHFLQLNEYLDLDPWLVRNFGITPSGWTCFTTQEGILNFQLLTSMYYIAWSVNRTRGRTFTKALLVTQRNIECSCWFSDENGLEARFKDSAVSLEDPCCLAVLVLLDVLAYMEKLLSKQWQVQVSNDRVTGHGMYGYADQEMFSSRPTQDLTLAARKVGHSVATVSSCIRLSDLAERMVLEMEDEIGRAYRALEDGRRTFCRLVDRWADHLYMIREFNSSKRRIWNFKLEIRDLDTRVKAQSDMIFALISNRHAEAVRRDSGSMKTMAIMTMAFLPGTFVAALFAIPSLDWTGPKVVTSGFWEYWAFTIPLTLMVFVAWRILNPDTPVVIKLAGRVIIGDKELRHA